MGEALVKWKQCLSPYKGRLSLEDSLKYSDLCTSICSYAALACNFIEEEELKLCALQALTELEHECSIHADSISYYQVVKGILDSVLTNRSKLDSFSEFIENCETLNLLWSAEDLQ